MGEILVVGGKQAGKTTLIKQCIDKASIKQEGTQDFQIWTDKQNNIIYYETHLNSADNFDVFYSKTPRIRECKVCWFLMPASLNVSSISDMIHPILAKKIRIVFIITQCDIHRDNSTIEDDIHDEFGSKHKIISLSLNEDFYSNNDEFKAKLNSLFALTNSYLKIFKQIDGDDNKPFAKPRSHSNLPSNTPMISKIESNQTESGIITSLLEYKYSKSIEIFFLHFGARCKEKDQFLKDFLGENNGITAENEKFQIHDLMGGKIVLYDILEVLNDETSIVDTLKTIRNRKENSFSIYSFFVPNKNMKSETEITIGETLMDFISDSPKILLSFKSKIKVVGIDVINSDKYLQAPKDEQHNLVTNFINHVTFASTFNSEKKLFLTGIQKFGTLVSTILEPFCTGSEQIKIAAPVSKHSSVNLQETNRIFNSNPVQPDNPSRKLSRIEEAKKIFESNAQASTNYRQETKPNQTIPRPASSDKPNRPCVNVQASSGYEKTMNKSNVSSSDTQGKAQNDSPKLSIIEQRKMIYGGGNPQSSSNSNQAKSSYSNNQSSSNSAKSSVNSDRKDFSILVIGEPNSRQSDLLGAMLTRNINLSKEYDQEFKIFAGKLPVKFIEYQGIQTNNDVNGFIERFVPIANACNCLVCWVTVKIEVEIMTKRLLKEMKEKLRIPSFIIYTHAPNNIGDKLREDPTKYNANHILWMPTDATIGDEGEYLEHFISDILSLSKRYAPSHEKTIDELLNNRQIEQEIICINQHDEFELRRALETMQNTNVEKFNLMLVGPTGVGKSTLINTLLTTKKKYDDGESKNKNEMAEVNNNKPCTMKIKEYEVKNTPITLIDTRGFELEKFEELKAIVNEAINERLNDRLRKIHMIWYCVRMNSNRFVKGENETIQEWKRMGIPIIIVMTNSVTDNSLDQKIHEDFNYSTYYDYKNAIDPQKILDEGIILTRILAQDDIKIDKVTKQRTCIAAYGLPELIELMKKFLPKEKSFIYAQMKEKAGFTKIPAVSNLSRGNPYHLSTESSATNETKFETNQKKVSTTYHKTYITTNQKNDSTTNRRTDSTTSQKKESTTNLTKDTTTYSAIKSGTNLSNIAAAIRRTDVNMINIMVIGNSGSGKSQLIRTIFDLDVESSVGCSVTQQIKQYMVPDKPLSIFDTVGFELGRFEEIKNQVMEEIETRAEDIPSKHIHIIWYVINDAGDRIQESDEHILTAIRKLGIPIIIVLNNNDMSHVNLKKYLTTGQYDHFEIPDLNQIISCERQKTRTELINKKISVIKTNARESYFNSKMVTPIYGTLELVELTQCYIDIASKKALNASIVNCSQKHKHVIEDIIPKFIDDVDKRWIFSTDTRKEILDDIIYKLFRNIMVVYNFDWTYIRTRKIRNSLAKKSMKYKKNFDSLTGGIAFFNAIRTKSQVKDFIEKAGRIFSESFKNLIRNKNSSKIDEEAYIEDLSDLFNVELN